MEKYSGIERKKLSNDLPKYWLDAVFEALLEPALMDNVKGINLGIHDADKALENMIKEAEQTPEATRGQFPVVLRWLEGEQISGDGFYRLRHALEYDWNAYQPDNEKLAREMAKEAGLKRNYVKTLIDILKKFDFAERLKKAGIEGQRKWNEETKKMDQLIAALVKSNPPGDEMSPSFWVNSVKEQWKK